MICIIGLFFVHIGEFGVRNENKKEDKRLCRQTSCRYSCLHICRMGICYKVFGIIDIGGVI